MAQNFSTAISYNGKTLLTIVIPTLRRNGMHYEVNMPGYPRFWMRWGPMERYEVVRPADAKLPDELVLAVSDAIEARQQR